MNNTSYSLWCREAWVEGGANSGYGWVQQPRHSVWPSLVGEYLDRSISEKKAAKQGKSTIQEPAVVSDTCNPAFRRMS